jgi:hypothetical protein
MILDELATPFLDRPTGIPVVKAVARLTKGRIVACAMNSINRLVFGVISTLMLAFGFTRAADRLDPMNKSLRNSLDGALCTFPCEVAAPCTFPCELASDNS